MANADFIKVGMIGVARSSGVPWDEKGRTEIVQIFIWHDEQRITGIQFQYCENGRIVSSHCHGVMTGNFFDIVKLNYPSEYITWIGGHSTYGDNYRKLSSLKIGTNCGEYGPFGENKGGCCKHNPQICTDVQSKMHTELQARWFKSPNCFHVSNHFGGFCGTTNPDGRLESIGVYVKPSWQPTRQ